MDEITLLNEEQILVYNELSILNKINSRAKITDFAVLLGGYHNTFIEIRRTGYYWIKSNSKYNIINDYGYKDYDNIKHRDNGIRPVMSYSNIKNDISNEIINENGIKEIGYGEYPQKTVNKKLQDELEELYQNNKLIKTGKTYTTDSRKWNDYDEDFLPQEHIEYEFDDKKYVRVKANSWYEGRIFVLSNGEGYGNGNYVWVEVSKVKWLVDEENDIALSKDILVAGIQFDNKEKYNDAFENSNIYNFLNTYFTKDIQIQETKLSGTYEEAMALIEEAKRRHNEILDKSIIGKTLIKHL